MLQHTLGKFGVHISMAPIVLCSGKHFQNCSLLDCMKKHYCQNDVKKCHNVIYYSITADQIIQRILLYYENPWK
jgi:hypothetical protein